MNTHTLQTVGIAVGLVLAACLAQAKDPELMVGSPAPMLQNGDYVQGEPIKGYEKDKAYIVEFWATWCGPCRASIPHLNKIYAKYKDKGLVVLGQNCWERDDKLVPPFVKKMADDMTYRVALDDKKGDEKGKMAVNWMEAAGQDGIPTAFLVDHNGKIAWIGHPMSIKEETIEAVLAGNYDLDKATKEYAEDAHNKSTLEAAWKDVSESMQQKKWDDAMTKLGAVEKLLPEEQRAALPLIRMNILIGKQDFPAAYKVAEEYSDAHRDSAETLNALAWQLVTDKNIKEPNLDLAERIANRANEAAKGKDADTVDTLARIQFMQGKSEKAIQTEQKAVDLADGDHKKELEKVLDSYKAGKLPSE